jgi:hypothetical protein
MWRSNGKEVCAGLYALWHHANLRVDTNILEDQKQTASIFNAEGGCSMCLCNIGIYLQVHMVQQLFQK